jgi:hypothetical protein
LLPGGGVIAQQHNLEGSHGVGPVSGG